MIWSAWDWDKMRYDYYEAPGQLNGGGWASPDSLGVMLAKGASSEIGTSLENLLPVIPYGSYIGSGDKAQGRIGRLPRSLQEVKKTPSLGETAPTEVVPPPTKDSASLSAFKVLSIALSGATVALLFSHKKQSLLPAIVGFTTGVAAMSALQSSSSESPAPTPTSTKPKLL